MTGISAQLHWWHELDDPKIIATLGPATDDDSAIEKLIRAGIDLVRINFSHGSLTDHQRRINTVRKCAAVHSRQVGILGDLQGPKIRVTRFQNGFVNLEPGRKFVLDARSEKFEGSQESVGVDYKQLPEDVNPGDILLLDDGRIELKVDRIDKLRIICTVKTGGELSNNKGINRRGGGLSAGALTDKDLEDLKAAAAMKVDYIAVSFVRHASDIQLTRRILEETKGTAGIIAKIERSEAIEAVDKIIQASDGVMIARGVWDDKCDENCGSRPGGLTL